MKVLFIGGTGNISSACSRLAIKKGFDLYLLNRGIRKIELEGSKSLVADINNPDSVRNALSGLKFDSLVNFIAFTPEDILRDYEIFKHNTKQYIFISSASAYQKPPSLPFITESTPLYNPYWQYSRDKIACEDILTELYRKNNFPITIVRPSLTYETVIPAAIGSWEDFTLIDRIERGKRIVVHGDGTSLWTITHASDFAVGLVGLIGHQQAIGHPFHITSDEVLTWNQIYDAMGEAVGRQVDKIHIPSDFIGEFSEHKKGGLLGDKSHSAIFDNSKIKQFVPEFNAVTPFKTGIKKTIEWFKANPSRMLIREENNALLDNIIKAYEKT